MTNIVMDAVDRRIHEIRAECRAIRREIDSAMADWQLWPCANCPRQVSSADIQGGLCPFCRRERDEE